jgi:hypothetical protein
MLTLDGMLNVYAYKRGSLPLRRFGQLHRPHCLIGLNNVDHLRRSVGSTSIKRSIVEKKLRRHFSMMPVSRLTLCAFETRQME